MPFDRTNIKTGPAILTFGGAAMYFQNGCTIDEVVQTFDVTADHVLAGDARVQDRYVEISGTPSGQWTNLGVWFPWLTAARGALAYGASDSAAVVHFVDGDKFTYHNAALVGMPDLMLSTIKSSMEGRVVLQARTKKNTLASASNSLFTRETASFSDTSFDWADILTPVLTLNWGSSPWDAFYTAAGVKISAKPKWQDITADGVGIVQRVLDGLEVTATFAPIGIAQSSIDSKLLMQGAAGAMIGARRASVASDLIISGTGLYVLMRNAFARKANMQSGSRARHGDLEAVATLGVTDGAAVAQLYLGDSAPA